MVQDNSDLSDQAIETHNQAAKNHGTAKELARAGRHKEAIIQLRSCLAAFERLVIEFPNNETIQTNQMLILHDLADALEAVGQSSESAAHRKRGFDVLFRLADAAKAATRFSFANREIDLHLNGTRLDVRRLLRNLESVVRGQTGLAQISIDFGADDLPEGTLNYSEDWGYRIPIAPSEVMGGALSRTETMIVEAISAHSSLHNVKSTPPPIARTRVSVHQRLELDNRRNRYDALGHDGGYFLAFYRDKSNGAATLLRHVPPVGFVHYRFDFMADYDALREDASAHCSAFLDLSSTDTDLSEDKLRDYLNENRLYGWGSRPESSAPKEESPVGEASLRSRSQ